MVVWILVSPTVRSVLFLKFNKINKKQRMKVSVRCLFSAGLFNKESPEKSRMVFRKISDPNTSDNSLRGRMIYPSVMDSYSTALEGMMFNLSNLTANNVFLTSSTIA